MLWAWWLRWLSGDLELADFPSQAQRAALAERLGVPVKPKHIGQIIFD